MRTCRSIVPLALCALAAFVVPEPSFAGPGGSALEGDRRGLEQHDARLRADGDLPTGQPIVATVVEVDEDAGRVTLKTAHGEVALEISEDLAQRLSPGDVVVLRLTDDDSDFPSASPREEEPAAPDAPRRI